MGSDITDDMRKWIEEFIREHPPYESDDPVLQYFDNPDADPYRLEATMYKALLDGKIQKKNNRNR